MRDENKTKAQLIEELRQMRAEAGNQAEKTLAEKQTQHDEAQRIAHLGHWTLDLLNNELVWSDENYRIFGVEPGTANTYQTFLKIVHPDDYAFVDRAYTESVKNHTPYDIEHRLLMQDGSIKWVNERCRTSYDDNGTPLRSIGTVLDITERKQAEEQIREMAYQDHLTGLPNRALFYDRLEQGLAHAHRNRKLTALLALDLDHFKSINDELGHEWGDQALIKVGKRLLQCVRATDTVARLGGDEFSIILVDVASEEAACKIAEKVITAISQPLSLKKSQYTLGVSIGIHLISPGDGDMENIINRADSAMYQAKKEGKNCYRISEQSLS
ncbi:MAG: diguanylate cyclase [Mariprofundaceae bacterium]|nr:diguanylate cyclase [Mariprofundaceae bacterium]